MQPKTKREKWLTDECTCELSELGARVLEILRDRDARQRECRPPSATIDVTALGDCLRAARSLGLLGKEGGA